MYPVLKGDNFKRMKREFQDVFDERPGMTQGVEHHILTPPGCVVRDHWRRLPRHLFGLVKAEIEQIREHGIIEESHSPWRSPMVIVSKPNGTIRLCIDYRKVNVVSTFDVFPMPHVEDMLKRVGQAQFIT